MKPYCSRMKRAVLQAGLSICALTMMGLHVSQAAERLTVAGYGGFSGDVLKQCAYDPFSKETGVEIAVEQGASLVTLQKLQQQKDRSAIDIAFMDSGISESAADSGVVAPLDPSRIPNLKNVLPLGLVKSKSGETYAMVTGFYAVGLMYNSKEITTAPTSWKELWNPKYEKLLSLPSASNLLGIMLISTAGKMFGSGPEDYETGIRELKKLKPAFYFDAVGTADSAFQAGEVVLGPNLIGTGVTMRKQGLPIAMAFPSEGVPAANNRIHLVKGGAKMALAERFVDFVARRETLTCFAEKAFWGPPLADPKLSDEARQNMPWGPGGSIDSLLLLDWNFVNTNRAKIVDLWNKAVLGK